MTLSRRMWLVGLAIFTAAAGAVLYLVIKKPPPSEQQTVQTLRSLGLAVKVDGPPATYLHFKSGSYDPLVELNNELMEQIGRFRDLRDLSIEGHFSEGSLIHLEQLTDLERLKVSGRWSVADSPLRHVRNLHRLRELHLGGRRLEEVELEGLKELPQIEFLEVSVRDSAWPKLPVVASLKRLKIRSLNDVGADRISTVFPNLEELHVELVEFSDDGLEELGQLRRLRRLELHGGERFFNGEGLRGLVHAKGLQELELWNCPVTTAGLARLPPLPNLKNLMLASYPHDASTNLGDAALAPLAACPNLEYVRLSYCDNVTDTGIAFLSKLHKLRELSLGGSKVTAAGAAKLKQSIPGVTLIYGWSEEGSGVGGGAAGPSP